MWTEIFANLQAVWFFAFVLAVIIVANIVLGTYHSIGKKKQTFKIKKLLDGLIRGAVVLVGVSLLAIGITAFFYGLALYGVPLSVDQLQVIGIMVLLMIFAIAIVKYVLGAYGNLRGILGIKITDTVATITAAADTQNKS